MDWLLFIILNVSSGDVRITATTEAQCKAALVAFQQDRAACLSPSGQWHPRPLGQNRYWFSK